MSQEQTLPRLDQVNWYSSAEFAVKLEKFTNVASSEKRGTLRRETPNLFIFMQMRTSCQSMKRTTFAFIHKSGQVRRGSQDAFSQLLIGQLHVRARRGKTHTGSQIHSRQDSSFIA